MNSTYKKQNLSSTDIRRWDVISGFTKMSASQLVVKTAAIRLQCNNYEIIFERWKVLSSVKIIGEIMP
jgi:hypothetical protein